MRETVHAAVAPAVRRLFESGWQVHLADPLLSSSKCAGLKVGRHIEGQF